MGILIVHHVKNNTLGLLESVLSQRKLPFQYAFGQDCFGQDLTGAQLNLEGGISGLIILGGKESVTEDQRHAFMPPEQQMIRNAIDSGVPVFGICLGAQMMARSLGAVVEKNKVAGVEAKEIGWTPLTLTAEGERDPVLSHLAGMSQFQWHEDTYRLPPGAVHLAESSQCAQQAFRLTHTNSPAYGVQFHPEMTLPVIRAWLSVSKTLSPERAQAIWQESEQAFALNSAASLLMFNAFCDLAF